MTKKIVFRPFIQIDDICNHDIYFEQKQERPWMASTIILVGLNRGSHKEIVFNYILN